MIPIKLFLIGITLFLMAIPLFGQETAHVLITTELGEIEIELDPVHAPLTTANFLKYVDGKFYDGGMFHRTVRQLNQSDSPVMIQIVQAGIDSKREAEIGPPIKLERTNLSGLKHLAGTISMARTRDPDSATYEFFICLLDEPELDYRGMPGGKGEGYAAFGRVSRGMEVVKAIQMSAADGQKLSPPIRIKWIRRVAPNERQTGK